jgi:corrinoid protein of di/trimethylamine methyltransferase
MLDLQQLVSAVIDGNAKVARALTAQALAEGHDPQVLVTKHLIPAMDEVGRRFESNEYFVPELLIAARAMKQAMELIKPLLSKAGVQPIAKVAIGTVKGDLHDIGKNLVASLLEGGGFEVIDLGVDVAADKFIAAVRDKGAKVVCLSALLTTTMPAMHETVKAFEQSGLRNQVRIMIGGAPITKKFADEIGADGYSDNASAAVTLARRLVGAA